MPRSWGVGDARITKSGADYLETLVSYVEPAFNGKLKVDCRTRPLHQNTAKVNPLIPAFSNSDYIHIVPHRHSTRYSYTHRMRGTMSQHSDVGSLQSKSVGWDVWPLSIT